MSDSMSAAPGGASNAHEYSVSELSQSLKRSVEDRFGHVRVRGELSGVKRAASGHLYLALKDENSLLDGVCWRGTAQRLTFRPEDGLEVICTGKLTTYGARSKYQMVIERMEPAGVGALMALLEDRKKKLAAEGLFAPERKQKLPFLPRIIGVITSPTGAVIRDILHRLSDRFPSRVLLWPVLVQGEGAAEQITRAIRGFNALDDTGSVPRPDLLIVARGGGSLEDLWSFNEESVVRAAGESAIPLISAVGHETDTTLIDYVSDQRAPTPTGAAEMAVPVRADLLAAVADLARRQDVQKRRMFDDRKDRLDALARALPSPHDIMGLKAQRLDDLSDRLPRALTSLLKDREAHLVHVSAPLNIARLRDRQERAAEGMNSLAQRMRPAIDRTTERLGAQLETSGRVLASLSYERVLERGFVLVTGEDGSPVTTLRDAQGRDRLALGFGDGTLTVAPIESEGAGAPQREVQAKPKSKPKTKVKTKTDTGQGSLF